MIIKRKKINIESSKFLGNIKIPDNYNYHHHKKLKYKDININFNFYDKKRNIRKSNTLINFLLLVIDFLIKVHNKKIDYLKITIINYDLEKTIPKDGIFKYENINSGWSVIYNNELKSNIVIFRKQELYKVFIHELIHSFRIYNFSLNNKKLDILFPNETFNELNEAIVESYACIINTIIYSIIKNEDIIENIKQEQLYSLDNAIKILNIIKNNKQYTNVVSYYIFKSLLIYNINSINSIGTFIKNLNDNNYVINKIINYLALLKKEYIINQINNINMCKLKLKTNMLEKIEIDIKLR